MQIEVERERAELAADALWRAGPSAVLEVDLGDGRVRLTADVADAALVDEGWAPVRLEVDDDAYLDAWRTWASPIRAGRAILLQPAWLEPAGAPDGTIVVPLDPGRAFGSGSHESTRLAVAAVEEHVRPGDRVLDVGCGSGVLAVVACRLGAASALGIDIEPEAIDATVANAARNGVGDRVEAEQRALGDVTGEHDLVVANIGGPVLLELAPDLVTRTRRGGVLVLSCQLEGRIDDLLRACPGTSEVARLAEAGWAAAVLRRDAR